MSIRKFLLTGLFLIGINFYNCSNCECCFGEVPEFFDIQDVFVDHLGLEGQLLGSDEIAFDEYGTISIGFEVEYLVQHSNYNSGFSLINSVYGCTPAQPGQLGSKEESIESFQVLTLNDFDDTHLAGESINDLLEITNLAIEPVPLEEFLTNFTENVPQEWFNLRLLNEPTLSKAFQVMVNVSLSTGENYQVSSSIINFE